MWFGLVGRSGASSGDGRPVCARCAPFWTITRDVLNGEKKKKVFRFPKNARGHPMCSTMVGGIWRPAVGGGWWLAVGGGWWLAVGGGWQLMGAGGWRLVVPWGGP